ncbi:uncharacterized protein LOC126689806 [Quercus robur]|uniref:uncharacterized protein LOC126689806 n=1 Tax=Quercus robur TaxID=38942 RepID=UPI0021615D82|nr:uncharacterized protein LOC126689806 [Quercus robur]
MSVPKDRFLSSEEEVELARSNKKVKDVNHADYNFSREAEAIRQDRYGRNSLSFKDKLMGEIPGAYNQAFELNGNMESNEDSDEEVAELRNGVAAVTLSKEVKQWIRAPWVNSLIVKVYGRLVGFHFLQARLISMWRPSGRMDIIDLGKEFYLVRFGLKEDFSEVLEKGPWFIGEHFLSIRPWEPNFKLSTANISSIGKAVGNVLRINTHTATEARGRYARLCIQVDVEKPLVTSVNIGDLDQPISYEGIHKLCFSCGRIGHRKDDCVYLLRATSPKEKADTDVQSNMDRADTGAQGNAERTTCMAHEGVVPTHAQGEGDTVQVGSVGTMDEDSYGPWVMVTRKKSGRKGPNIGSTSASKTLKQEWVNSPNRANDFSRPNNKAMEDGLGLKREGKRKADLVVIGKRTNGPEGVGQAGDNVSKGEMLKTKANGSIRGKKGIA